MDSSTVIYAVGTVIALVGLFMIAHIAFRWAIRLAIIGTILVAMLVGATWWWLQTKSSTRFESKPRPSPTRRATNDRR